MKEAEQKIDATLYDAVLYLSLLHMSGAVLYDAVESLSRNANHLGKAAEEFCQVIADTDSGYSIYEALERLSIITPSKTLSRFLSGYLSAVKTTGSSVSYLEDTLFSLQEERAVKQKTYLETLSVLGEIFLVLFVAGPLFVVIAAMVLGMISGVEPAAVAVCLFLALPLGTIAFLILLDSMDADAKVPHRDIVIEEGDFSYEPLPCGTDESKLFQALKNYEQREKRRAFLKHPCRFFSGRPAMVYIITVPIAIIAAAIFQTTVFVQFFSLLSPVPDFLETAILLLMIFVPFAVFSTKKERRGLAVESTMPEILRKLFEMTSRGVSLSDAVSRIAEADKSPLKNELYQISCDIMFGGSVQTAFSRFASKMKIPSITRIAVSLKESIRFGYDLPGALRMLSTDAKTRIMMRKERMSSMSTYVVVIYLGFAVFLFVMGIMLTVFLDAMALTSDVSALGMSVFPVLVYEEMCVWAVLVHAVCSGISAGKMGSGSIVSGVKHACVLVAVGASVMVGIGMT